MAQYDYDLFTIGAGSGGVRASRMSASYSAKVAVAEERYLGGTCVNVGCIPKKLLVYAAHFSEDFEDAAGFGWTVGERHVDWAKLIANKNAEISRLNGVYRKLLQDSGVTIIESRAEVVDPHTVAVGGKKITAKYILIAVGSWPTVPEFPGSEYAITSNEIFFLPTLPKKVIIVGGGYIGAEFAGIFHGLGVEVTQLYWGPLFLRGFDDDCRKTLAVVVDDYSKTDVDSIYAIGDCTNRMQLTPVAIAEGRAVAETLFNNNPMKPNYMHVPSVVFSQPNLGTVGLTETEARERYIDIDVYKTTFRPLKHTVSGRGERTMMKIVVDHATDKVLGCHMVGPDAGEIIQGLAVAMNCGATKAQFDATIGIHPTAAEEFVTMRTAAAPGK
jgi:glutathione reductase (NADPH)